MARRKAAATRTVLEQVDMLLPNGRREPPFAKTDPNSQFRGSQSLQQPVEKRRDLTRLLFCLLMSRDLQ